MNVHVFPMPISIPQWGVLSAAISVEPDIMGSRNTAEKLRWLYEFGLAVVLLDNGEAVGFKAAWPVEDGFLEVGSVWVRKDLRGQGLSHLLYQAIVELPKVKQAITFGITKSPWSVKAGTRVGFESIRDWTHPIPWRLTCAPCDFVQDECKQGCFARNTTCWLRVLNAR